MSEREEGHREKSVTDTKKARIEKMRRGMIKRSGGVEKDAERCKSRGTKGSREVVRSPSCSPPVSRCSWCRESIQGTNWSV